ncbi:hypothetical protein TVAG_403820 [Trichomonas vaginalis G3]|uniref:Uncharacterized protein n=1 Tax=Trichomonas vaginalis (strain ATCC PRA-98 / G3) TaxID=412133 RepID=A2ELR0_TRIV3|nr:hypothetical protein TVAG_403820 [Trichomonas vaginalis G3]|eukprot:XP_001318648.1 hypothetical protein [Trichomonas vaginalis G3]
MFDSSDANPLESQPADFYSESTNATAEHNEQLKEDNANLIKQNSLLKAQFESAVALAAKTKEISKENAQLKTKILEMTSQRDDYINRLEIATRSQKEALNKLEEQKKNFEEARANEIYEIQKEMNLTTQSWKKKIDELNSQIQERDENIKSYQISEEVLKQKLLKLINNINQYLAINIADINELFLFFESPPPQNTSSVLSQTQSFNQNISEINYQQKINNMKSKIKQMKNVIVLLHKNSEDSENENKKKILEFHKKEKEYITEISRLKNIIDTNTEDYKVQINDYQNQIKLYEERVAMLKDQISKSPARAPPQIIIQKPEIPQVIEQNKKKPKCKAVINELKDKVNSLTTQNKALQTKISELSHKIDESDTEIINLNASITKYQNEASTKSKLLEESEEQLKSLRNTITSSDKNHKDVMKSHEIQFKKQSQSISMLEKTNEVLKKEIVENQLKISELEQNVQKLNNEIKQKAGENEKLKDEIKNLNDELLDAKLELQKPQPTEADFVPASSWNVSHFEKDLQEKLNSIIANPSLKAGSKIQTMLSCIADHQHGVITQIEDELQKINIQNSQRMSTINNFIVSLSILLTGNSIPLDYVLKGQGTELLNIIKDMQQKLLEYSHENDSYRKQIDYINSSFDNQFSSVEDIASYSTSMIKNYQSQINKQKKKIKNLERAISMSEESNEELNNTVSKLNLDIERLNAEKENSTKTINNLRKDNQSLREKVKNLEQSEISISKQNQEEISSIEESYISKIKECEENRAKEIQQFQIELQNALKENKSLQKSLDEYKERVQSQNSSISSQIETKEIQIKKEKTQSTKMIEKLEMEKKLMKESYERTVNELGKKLKDYSVELTNLNQIISDLQTKYNKTSDQLTKSELSNENLKRDLKNLEEEIQREKQLLRASTTSQIQEYESKLSAVTGEEKLKIETEKRKIFTYAASTLNNLFSTNEKLDERSFKSLISKAKETIDKLSSTDAAVRRLVNAVPGQSTEDAVAHFVWEQDKFATRHFF